MNIVKEDIDSLNAVLKIEVSKEDYADNVEESLRKYSKQVKMDGFRPGKVPFGLVKKMYGPHMLVDEVNKLVSDKLYSFIQEEKLKVLGEPLPNEDKQQNIDWNSEENFEFFFDIALAPEFEVKLTKRQKIAFYKIAVNDEMIDSQVDQLRSSFGSQESVEEIEGSEMIKVAIAECDENGELVEGGHTKEEGTILVSSLKNEEKKKELFIGKKVGENIVFNPLEVLENETEVAAMLGLESSNTEALSKTYKFQITDILRFQKAELDQELFDKAFGEGAVKSEEELRAKIKEDGESRFVQNSDYLLLKDFKEKMRADLSIDMPETFLKKWLTAINKDKKDITEEDIDKDFPLFLEDLHWQLVKNKIIEMNDIKVSPEEHKEAAKNFARLQLQQFGFYNASEEDIEKWGEELVKNREEGKKIYETELDKKIIAFVKESIKLDEKEVSLEEFNEMLQK